MFSCWKDNDAACFEERQVPATWITRNTNIKLSGFYTYATMPPSVCFSADGIRQKFRSSVESGSPISSQQVLILEGQLKNLLGLVNMTHRIGFIGAHDMYTCIYVQGTHRLRPVCDSCARSCARFLFVFFVCVLIMCALCALIMCGFIFMIVRGYVRDFCVCVCTFGGFA